MCRAMLRALTVASTLLIAATAAHAAQYYVRMDGNDACNGSTNAAGLSGNCAFKTIAKCETTARCGDSCNVAAGEYFETATINIADACTSTTRKRIVGAGPSSTTVFLKQYGPLTCTKRTGSTYVYECDVPTGAVTDSSSADQADCFIQTLGATSIGWEPEPGVKQSYRHSACLTPATSETSIDANDDGAADSSLDSPAGEGFWVHTSGSTKYLVHPYGHLAPGSSVKFYPPAAGQSGDLFVIDRGKYVTVEGLKIMQGRVYVTDNTEGVEFRNLTSYHQGIWAGVATSGTSQAKSMLLENTKFLQMIRRIRNKGCGLVGNPCSSTADFSSPQACVIRGNGTLVNGLECYSGNEGLSFGGEGHQIRNVISHGFYNHGCKFNERYENSTIENILCYNSQEGMHWVNCQKNITIKHATIDGTILIQGQYDTTTYCTDGSQGQWNVDFYNSALRKISYNDPYGVDPRVGARGIDTDFNVYFNDGSIITHNRPDPAPNSSFSTVESWRSYSGDTCTNCVRDPNSTQSTESAMFVNPSGDDLDSSLADYNLKNNAIAINFGATSYAPSDNKDIRGYGRVGRPDVGGYEYGATSGATCGNSIIESGEQCDGASLGGATCTSLGFTGGTLTCGATCAYNTAACTQPDPPPAPTSVRRTDRR